MKKVFALVIVTLFAVSMAYAETPTEKAVGYDGMLGGLSYRAMMGGLGLQGIVGLDYESPADTDNFSSALDLNLGVGVFKCMWECDRANLNGFAGIAIMMDGSTMKDSDSETDFDIAVGLEPEIFLLDNLSVSTKFGLMIAIEGDCRGADGKTVTDSGGMNFGTYGQGVSIVEGLSFNWYF